MADIDSDTSPLSDLEMDHVLPVFPDSSKPCVDTWMEKFGKGLLSYTHFKDYWRIWVPKIYSPEPNGNCLDWNFDEDHAQKYLYEPLEQFICNGNPQEILKNLSQLDSPPSICGRVFKVGEPTYSCRECGMDSTCVLCVECFKNSIHKHHKYKMGTSGGGGCCDCGDTEAWKSGPFCDIHVIGTQVQEAERNNLDKLPKDLVERARAVFSSVLKYSYHLLTLEHTPGLPSDLQLRDADKDPLELFDTPGTFCTVLYNDETHTFEQVINTLVRVIKCSQKDAIDFVTNIDREGRAVVKCSTFQHCNEVKSEIERFTSRHGHKPLKVLVMHSHVVAHQHFALKILSWLQKTLGYAEGFRILFSEVALQTQSPDASILEGILLRDTHLWKSARSHWHRLFIAGMLMEYDSKKAFAKVFTKHYGNILKDFITDDHDHSFSIASLSVQIFTVPTLAHYLIAQDEVLAILLHTFISECSRKCNDDGKLEFERNVPHGTFKRAQCILFDLRYLLSAKPETWTDPLRKGFLHGFSLLLNLLAFMQGMDAVVRQVGQHMEYEPEWESAFNLHIKLACVITLALEWCGTDRVVLIKAYRSTLKKLYDNPCPDMQRGGVVRELADHSVACLGYDVSSQPVSVHLPLSRVLAGLHLHLEKFGMSFDSPEFQIKTKPTPEQIIEPVLRTQVMIAQVHAGMWRRNGYSLLNQLYFYHNVKCRTEMMDRDITLLQLGAALIESNEFLIHVLNKFNLMNWAHAEFEINTLKNPEEDSIRQPISLVEEFLGLLITLVGERHTPGVGQITDDDRITKEIVQQLCIKPLPHSELNKTLPEDVNHETGMERVIDNVAVFKKPTQAAGKGVYELKPEYYKDYNVFFYHYTREELSKSEETQRKRRKALGELECCPPPPLALLSPSFSMIANLLQCDVMLYIMKIVLERCVNLRARSFSETQLHKILHLIGYALHEEERQHSEEGQFVVFTEHAEKRNIFKLLEELVTSPRVEAHKDLITWTIRKYRQVAALRKQNEVIMEPITETSTTEKEGRSSKEEKEWRASMAAKRRAKIMAQMTAMQKNFMKENAKLFEATVSDSGDMEDLSGSSMDLSETLDVSPVALGLHQTLKLNTERSYTCILCQEGQKVSCDGKALVLAGFVQKSTVLSQFRKRAVLPADGEDADESNQVDPLFLAANLGPAPLTSTCGHVMHSHCWQKYFDNVLAKENRRPYRLRQPVSFDIEKHEFLCPLCECLSNTVLPLVPPLGTLQSSDMYMPASTISFESWVQGLKITLKYKKELSESAQGSPEGESQDTPPHSCYYTSTARWNFPKTTRSNSDSSAEGASSINKMPRFYTCPLQQVVNDLGPVGIQFGSMFPVDEETRVPPQLSDSLLEMITFFSQATYTKGLGVHPHSEDPRVPLLTWQSCSYTIHSLECLLRELGKPLLGDLSCRQQDCLEGLVRIAGALGSTWKQPQVISSHALSLLSILLDNPNSGPCILDWDSFGLLVPLSLSLPSLFCCNSAAPVPSGSVREQYVLKLVLISHIVKVLLTLDLEHGVPMEVEDIDAGDNEDRSPVEEVLEAARVVDILNVVRKAAGLSGVQDLSQVNPCLVWKQVTQACVPFLRCSVLFYHFLTGVPVPQELTKPGGDTFSNLCHYLGFSGSCQELLGTTLVSELAVKWAQHEQVKHYLSAASNVSVVQHPLPVNSLVKLPSDYSELINNMSVFSCPKSDREDSRNPTMCLVCGEILCSQSYCCQTELNKMLVGACTYHAYHCGAGVGIFLRIRDCEVLLLASSTKGCYMSPPYLDQYGETDQGLRRGNPLHLCEERYKKLQLLWLSHGIPEEIARSLESSTNLVATQWQHL